MWYRLAEQGYFDRKTSTGESMMKLLRNFVIQSIEDEERVFGGKCPLCNEPGLDGIFCEDCGSRLTGGQTKKTGKKIINQNKLMSFIQNSELNPYISNIEVNSNVNYNGQYSYYDKTITIRPKFDNWQEIWQMLTTFQHELNHALSPTRPIEYSIWNNSRQKKILQLRSIKGNEKLTDQQIKDKYESEFKKLEENFLQTRGRSQYFSDEEIRAQTINIKNSFDKNILSRVYSKYYKKNPQKFLDDYKKFIAELAKFNTAVNALESPEMKKNMENHLFILQNYPELKEKYFEAIDIKDYEKAASIYFDAKDDYRVFIIKKTAPSLEFLDKVGAITGYNDELFRKLYHIKDPKFFTNLQKQLASQIPEIEKILNVSSGSGNFKGFAEKTKKLEPEKIQALTANSPEVQKPVTPKVNTALQEALPVIINAFNKLNEAIQKIGNTRVGKVIRVGLIAKDVIFITTSSNKILNDIKNQKELQYKDIYDLGLSIVSLLSDPDTAAIVSKIYPPAALLLRNPEVMKWMIIINVSANTLQALVQAADYLGTAFGTTNPNVSQLSGILNTPGSLQQLSMTASQLKETYGEVYNALVDIEKGMKSDQAFYKHIPQSDPLIEYKKVLLNRFLQNRRNLKKQQINSKEETYPTSSSAYSISSYKKLRDQQNKMNVPIYNNKTRYELQ